jgi:hypothetical protein
LRIFTDTMQIINVLSKSKPQEGKEQKIFSHFHLSWFGNCHQDPASRENSRTNFVRVTRIPPQAEKNLPRILRGILTTIPARTRELFNSPIRYTPVDHGGARDCCCCGVPLPRNMRMHSYEFLVRGDGDPQTGASARLGGHPEPTVRPLPPPFSVDIPTLSIYYSIAHIRLPINFMIEG